MEFEIKIPKSLEEIKLKTVLDFSRISQKKEKSIVGKVVDYFTEEERRHEQMLVYKVFEMFTNVEKKHVNLIPYDVAKETLERVTKVLESKPQDRAIVELNGVRYGRIPNLEVISFGEYIELDTFVTPLFEGKIDKEYTFKFLSCLYRPIVSETNNIYSIKEFTNEYIDQEHWRVFEDHCPSDIYASSVAFFLNLKTELLKAMKVYFQEAKLAGHESNLVKIGDGMEVLKHMHKVNLQLLTKHLTTLLQLPSIPLPMMQKQEG